MSQLEVDKIIPQSGTTLTIGDSGDTISFAEGTNLGIDTNTLVIDSTNNRVGIKNASPTVELDVTGSTKISGDLTVDTNTLYVDSANNRVGIGTTSPNTPLQIESTASGIFNIATLKGTTSGNAPRLVWNINSSGTQSDACAIRPNSPGANQGGMSFEVVPSAGTLSEAMRIDSSGNVGIKNTSPSHTLDISDTSTTAKTLRVGQSSGASTADATMIISNGGTGNAMLRFDYEGTNTDRARIGITSSGQNLQFFTAGNNERMRITSAGLVGIGTSSPATPLHLTSTSYPQFRITNAISFSMGVDSNNDLIFDPTSGSTRDIIFQNSGAGGIQVGIGTSSPSKELHVYASSGESAIQVEAAAGDAGLNLKAVSTSASFVNFGDESSNNVGQIYYPHSGNYMHFKTNGSERMRIDSSGNVGIGTSSPTGKLTVDNGSIHIGNNGEGVVFGSDTNTNNAIYGNATNNFIALQTAGSERMRIDSSGNVNIGTATAQLSSAGRGNITLNGSSDAIINMSVGDVNKAQFYHGGTDMFIANKANGYLKFETNATERMRINSSGYIGIGNTNPVKLCEITSNSAYNTAVLLVENGNGSTFNSVVSEIRGGRATTNGSYYLFQGTNGNSSGLFRILDSGNAQNTNNSYGGTSDLKLKENIVDANSQWEDIKALPIKKYSFKLENSETPTQIGVIAQDLETAGMNGLVEETVDRDEDGNDLGTTTKSVKYSVLYMKAVKALQEAMQKIEDLEARVNTLEGN